MASIEPYLLKNGGIRWRVRYRTPDRRQTDKKGFKTKRDAKQFADETETSIRHGAYVAPALGKATIGECGPAWLARQRGHQKPHTQRAAEVSWRVHVEPKWKHVRLSDVRHTDVQAWVSNLSQERGPKVVRAAHGVLSRILEDAVRDRRIASNPARGVKLPPVVRKPHRYLTQGQLIQLAREAGRYQTLVLLLGTAGLRWGEAAGLQVGDIDFRHGTIRIHRNATGGIIQTLKGGEHRTVAVAPFVLKELAATVQGKSHDSLIWPSQSGGYLNPPSTHDSWLSGAVARCQAASSLIRLPEATADALTGPYEPAFPRVTAHDLRHTAASLAVASGGNVKVVQRMLGHKSAAMTLDVYADLFDDELTAVADRLEDSVGKMWAELLSALGSADSEPSLTSTIVLDVVAPPDGLEPSTVRLTVGSSAN